MIKYFLKVFSQIGDVVDINCKNYQDCKDKFNNEYKEFPYIVVLAFKMVEDRNDYETKLQCIGMRRNSTDIKITPLNMDLGE